MVALVVEARALVVAMVGRVVVVPLVVVVAVAVVEPIVGMEAITSATVAESIGVVVPDVGAELAAIATFPAVLARLSVVVRSKMAAEQIVLICWQSQWQYGSPSGIP